MGRDERTARAANGADARRAGMKWRQLSISRLPRWAEGRLRMKFVSGASSGISVDGRLNRESRDNSKRLACGWEGPPLGIG